MSAGVEVKRSCSGRTAGADAVQNIGAVMPIKVGDAAEPGEEPAFERTLPSIGTSVGGCAWRENLHTGIGITKKRISAGWNLCGGYSGKDD